MQTPCVSVHATRHTFSDVAEVACVVVVTVTRDRAVAAGGALAVTVTVCASVVGITESHGVAPVAEVVVVTLTRHSAVGVIRHAVTIAVTEGTRGVSGIARS